MTHAHAGDYGVDAPPGLAAKAVLGLALAGWARGLRQRGVRWWPVPAAASTLVAMIGAGFVYSTRYGKFEVWEELVDALDLPVDADVLDIGCGRGLVLMEMARRVPQGFATGVDLWVRSGQSGNAMAAARANARAEGVSDRVDLETGDMQRLPFEDDRFDAVTSSMALHWVRGADAQCAAVDEALRVLRPGGTFCIVEDIYHGRRIAEHARCSGCTDVTMHALGWRCSYGGPPWSVVAVRGRAPTTI